MVVAPRSLLPWATATLPGVGGRVKAAPEDFTVEELGESEPEGRGEFLWLWLERRDLAHFDMLRLLATALDLDAGDIGYAGMKDRRAVTRQWLSVPAHAAGAVATFAHPALRVLRAARHGKKLRMGHLRGNRFVVLVRDVVADAEARAAPILARLTTTGIPNYYGAQRFGTGGSTLVDGRAALVALRDGQRPALSGKRLRLGLSAVQSSLFNEVLARRVEGGWHDEVVAGDVAFDVRTGLLRWIEARELEAANASFLAHALFPTGPMFGPKMRQPRGAVLDLERQVLAAADLRLGDFAHSKLTIGARRPLVVFPEALTCTPVPEGLRLTFDLPAGSYATVLLAELLKSPTADPDAETQALA